jgi:hypothetical protein
MNNLCKGLFLVATLSAPTVTLADPEQAKAIPDLTLDADSALHNYSFK